MKRLSFFCMRCHHGPCSFVRTVRTVRTYFLFENSRARPNKDTDKTDLGTGWRMVCAIHTANDHSVAVQLGSLNIKTSRKWQRRPRQAPVPLPFESGNKCHSAHRNSNLEKSKGGGGSFLSSELSPWLRYHYFHQTATPAKQILSAGKAHQRIGVAFLPADVLSFAITVAFL